MRLQIAIFKIKSTLLNLTICYRLNEFHLHLDFVLLRILGSLIPQSFSASSKCLLLSMEDLLVTKDGLHRRIGANDFARTASSFCFDS